LRCPRRAAGPARGGARPAARRPPARLGPGAGVRALRLVAALLAARLGRAHRVVEEPDGPRGAQRLQLHARRRAASLVLAAGPARVVRRGHIAAWLAARGREPHPARVTARYSPCCSMYAATASGTK